MCPLRLVPQVFTTYQDQQTTVSIQVRFGGRVCLPARLRAACRQAGSRVPPRPQAAVCRLVRRRPGF